MPSDLQLKTMNLVHRVILKASFGKVGWEAMGMPVVELTTTGRKTGKRRSRCVRVVRRGDRAYLVAIKGVGVTGWAKNALANPEVTLRLRDGRFTGTARKLRAEEHDDGRDAYSAGVHRFERLEWKVWREDSFSPAKSRDLHEQWFDTGTPLVVELADANRS